MKISHKILSVLAPLALMTVSPIVLAQNQNSEIVQTAAVDIAKNQRPASWHGKKVALRGRDVVSFTEGSKPVKGSKKYAAEWDDTKWYFSNEKNRDLFESNPDKYVPGFGGWCPVALSRGEMKVGRTNQFTRVDEKLYLNYNKTAQREFAKDAESYIYKAEISW